MLRRFIALAVLALSPQAYAADPAQGERLARRWCAGMPRCGAKPDERASGRALVRLHQRESARARNQRVPAGGPSANAGYVAVA